MLDLRLQMVSRLVCAQGHPMSLVCLILSIVIFAKKSMRNSSTTFLIALNLAEAYSVATLAIFQACSFEKKCSDTWLYNQFKLYSTTYLGIASQRCVYVYNCLVAVQRCLVVAYPVKFKTNRVLNEPLAVCVFVLLLSLTLHAYIPVKYAVVSKNNSHSITESRLATSHVSLFNALTSTSMYLLMYTPLILGTISNLVMCVALRRHALNMRRSSATPGTSKRRDSQMSTGILVSTFLFFTLSLPSNVNQLVSLHVDNYGALKAEQYLYQTLQIARRNSKLKRSMKNRIIIDMRTCEQNNNMESLDSARFGRLKKKKEVNEN
ncbi:proto-oncogene Mas-like isoform X2 [Biomphalaria glabrata]|uniref:Proto-oncogene Mas-like isoform X2 n=1 Tax=Biomphalaria glabrata TaxID=6526 RepID=A0A9W2ZD45_BIOGL|nr:proto-oncogene Mas-like isoform X2 [Biomphalaria glabrata]